MRASTRVGQAPTYPAKILEVTAQVVVVVVFYRASFPSRFGHTRCESRGHFWGGGLMSPHPKPTPGAPQGFALLIGSHPGRGRLEHIQYPNLTCACTGPSTTSQ